MLVGSVDIYAGEDTSRCRVICLVQSWITTLIVVAQVSSAMACLFSPQHQKRTKGARIESFCFQHISCAPLKGWMVF